MADTPAFHEDLVAATRAHLKANPEGFPMNIVMRIGVSFTFYVERVSRSSLQGYPMRSGEAGLERSGSGVRFIDTFSVIMFDMPEGVLENWSV